MNTVALKVKTRQHFTKLNNVLPIGGKHLRLWLVDPDPAHTNMDIFESRYPLHDFLLLRELSPQTGNNKHAGPVGGDTVQIPEKNIHSSPLAEVAKNVMKYWFYTYLL